MYTHALTQASEQLSGLVTTIPIPQTKKTEGQRGRTPCSHTAESQSKKLAEFQMESLHNIQTHPHMAHCYTTSPQNNYRPALK